ncbi:MAG: HipA N-terminal domain-containing protein [Pseudonocardiaceae bacterium]
MTLREIRHAVWLRSDRVGTLFQRGDYTRFVFAEEYRDDPDRPVLGLVFEQDLSARRAAALRLPCWFSNLLPERRLREWIAADRKVSPQREMGLLAQVGHDTSKTSLKSATSTRRTNTSATTRPWPRSLTEVTIWTVFASSPVGWRSPFSTAY